MTIMIRRNAKDDTSLELPRMLSSNRLVANDDIVAFTVGASPLELDLQMSLAKRFVSS